MSEFQLALTNTAGVSSVRVVLGFRRVEWDTKVERDNGQNRFWRNDYWVRFPYSRYHHAGIRSAAIPTIQSIRISLVVRLGHNGRISRTGNGLIGIHTGLARESDRSDNVPLRQLVTG